VDRVPCEQHLNREATHRDVVMQDGKLRTFLNCPDCHLRFVRMLDRFVQESSLTQEAPGV
jgi:hypothetical protein